MGISWISGIRAVSYHINMKFFIISALVAAVSAEAQYTYAGFPYAGGYNLGLRGLGYGYGALPYAGYAPYAGVPFGSSTGLDPITQGLDPVTQGAVYGKREAEADADAQIVSPYTAGYTGYPYTAGYAGYPYTAGYAGLAGLGYRYGKRSADAEADAQVLTTPYTAGYAGYPYTAGYAGYPY